MQKIIFPWNSAKWSDIKTKFIDSKISSIAEMDSKISSMHVGSNNKIHTRQITEMFTQYYSDDKYSKDRVDKDHFINDILPFLQSLLASGPRNFKSFEAHVLAPGFESNVSFNRLQAATIITAMWFGLFNYNYLTRGSCKLDQFPDPVFTHAWSDQSMFFLSCMMNYFSRVYDYMHMDEDNQSLFAAGNIIVKRSKYTPVDWLASSALITEVALGEGLSDDAPTKLITSYSSELIGGDELFKGGMSQECVVLLTRPECIIATLVCARLTDAESVVVLGAEKMSQYTGYGASVQFSHNLTSQAKLGYSTDETEVMTRCAIIFIDASKQTDGKSQFVDNFERDLNKAYSGFSSLKFKKVEPIATANWSYKFSGANMQIKFIQQVLAASQAGKSLIYYPFGRDFDSQVAPFIEWMMGAGMTVGKLFGLYLQLLDHIHSVKNPRFSDVDIFDFMMGA